MTISLSGNDTVNIGGRTLVDFADGDIATLEFPNEIMKVKTGKNGNSLFALDATGLQCDVKVRVIRGSTDDRYLNSLVSAVKRQPETFVLLSAEFVKRIGDGRGNVSNDTYVLSGGVPTKQVGGSSNVQGETEQSVAIYEFKFTNTNRALRESHGPPPPPSRLWKPSPSNPGISSNSKSPSLGTPTSSRRS